MKKTTFQVEINKPGKHNADILGLVAIHNGGSTNLTLSDFESWVRIEKGRFPSLSEGLQCILDNERSCIHISEDFGKTTTLSIDLITYHELEEAEKNDELPDEGTHTTYIDDLKEIGLFAKEFQPEHPIVKQVQAKEVWDENDESNISPL